MADVLVHNCFASSAFDLILSEARKTGLSLTIANQYLSQLPNRLRDSVFGNVGTTICFRVGPIDAPIMASQLDWHTPAYLSDLSKFTALVRVFPGAPMEYTTDKPPEPRDPAPLIENSRVRFGRDREKVEEKIRKFLQG